MKSKLSEYQKSGQGDSGPGPREKRLDALAELIGRINGYRCQSRLLQGDGGEYELFRDDKIICEAFDLAGNKAAFVNGDLNGSAGGCCGQRAATAGWGDVNEIRTRSDKTSVYLRR